VDQLLGQVNLTEHLLEKATVDGDEFNPTLLVKLSWYRGEELLSIVNNP